VVSMILGAEATSIYSVTARLFAIPSIVVSQSMATLWPAYGEALTCGDIGWARSARRSSIRLGIGAATTMSLGLVVLGQPTIRAWAGPRVVPGSDLLLAFAAWTIEAAVACALAVFLCGMRAMRFQVVCSITTAIANLVLSIVLTRRLGVSGVVWGSLVAQFGGVLVPSAIFVMRWRQVESEGFGKPGRGFDRSGSRLAPHP